MGENDPKCPECSKIFQTNYANFMGNMFPDHGHNEPIALKCLNNNCNFSAKLKCENSCTIFLAKIKKQYIAYILSCTKCTYPLLLNFRFGAYYFCSNKNCKEKEVTDQRSLAIRKDFNNEQKKSNFQCKECNKGIIKIDIFDPKKGWYTQSYDENNQKKFTINLYSIPKIIKIEDLNNKKK